MVSAFGPERFWPIGERAAEAGRKDGQQTGGNSTYDPGQAFKPDRPA
jgi:hypothetical protein